MEQHGFESFIKAQSLDGVISTTFVCLCGSFFPDRAAYDQHLAQAPAGSVVPDGLVGPDAARLFKAPGER